MASGYADLGPDVKFVSMADVPSPLPPGTTKLATHGELFLADEPLARFVMSMSMAAGDISLAASAARQHTEADSPGYIYFHRVAIGHWYEAMDALDAFSEAYPKEVGTFLKSRLPADLRAELKTARRSRQAIVKQMEHSRQYTFHYPHPKGHGSEGLLARYLDRVRDVPVEMDHADPVVRLSYAQMASFATSFGRYSPEMDVLHRQMDDGADGVGAYVRFAYGAVNVYMQLKIDGKL